MNAIVGGQEERNVHLQIELACNLREERSILLGSQHVCPEARSTCDRHRRDNFSHAGSYEHGKCANNDPSDGKDPRSSSGQTICEESRNRGDDRDDGE